MDMEEIVVHQGLLDKKKSKANISGMWNSRWFVITVNPSTDRKTFAYLKSQGHKSAEYSTDLVNISDVFIIDDDERTFQVTAKDKLFILRAPNDAAFDVWITCLAKFVDDQLKMLGIAANKPKPKPGGLHVPGTHSLGGSAPSSPRNKPATLQDKEKKKKEEEKNKEKELLHKPGDIMKPKLDDKTANRVEADLAKAKQKAADKAKKEEPAVKASASVGKETDPETAAALLAKREQEIELARQRALERIRKKKEQEEAAKPKEVEVAPVEVDDEKVKAQREKELAVARQKAADRIKKAKDAEEEEAKRQQQLAAAAEAAKIDPEEAARIKAQREKELEFARQKAQERAEKKRKEEEAEAARKEQLVKEAKRLYAENEAQRKIQREKEAVARAEREKEREKEKEKEREAKAERDKEREKEKEKEREARAERDKERALRNLEAPSDSSRREKSPAPKKTSLKGKTLLEVQSVQHPRGVSGEVVLEEDNINISSSSPADNNNDGEDNNNNSNNNNSSEENREASISTSDPSSSPPPEQHKKSTSLNIAPGLLRAASSSSSPPTNSRNSNIITTTTTAQKTKKASLFLPSSIEGGAPKQAVKLPASKCDLCFEGWATVLCTDCGNMKLCEENGCDEDMHRSASKKNHDRVPIESNRRTFSKMVVCYCCGQQFTVPSLRIHVESCPLKRKLVFRDLPAELRPSMPKPPSTPIPDEDDDRAAVFKAFNEEATAIYKDTSMILCPFAGCGRRFEPDRVVVHLRGCKYRERGRME